MLHSVCDQPISDSSPAVERFKLFDDLYDLCRKIVVVAWVVERSGAVGEQDSESGHAPGRHRRGCEKTVDQDLQRVGGVQDAVASNSNRQTRSLWPMSRCCFLKQLFEASGQSLAHRGLDQSLGPKG